MIKEPRVRIEQNHLKMIKEFIDLFKRAIKKLGSINDAKDKAIKNFNRILNQIKSINNQNNKNDKSKNKNEFNQRKSVQRKGEKSS